MKKVSLKKVFYERNNNVGAPGSPNLNKDKDQDILFDDSESCSCKSTPCTCVSEGNISSTGCASSEGMRLEEKELCEMAPKKKTPGPGPEFEHDPHVEDLESSLDFDDMEDQDSEESEDEEYLDDFEGEIELEDDEDESEEESEDEKYLRRQGYGRKDPRDSEEKTWRDVDIGGFIDPDDMPW
jgi:hypothetical protein